MWQSGNHTVTHNLALCNPFTVHLICSTILMWKERFVQQRISFKLVSMLRKDECLWSLTHGGSTWVSCVSPQSWGHGWGRWVILALDGEEAFSCFAHYNCTEAWHPPSSCLVEIMLRYTTNRTSFWKTAWLKAKLSKEESCGYKVFTHAYDILLMYVMWSHCIKALE